MKQDTFSYDRRKNVASIRLCRLEILTAFLMNQIGVDC